MFRRVYLDNAATTPVDPEALAAMLPFLNEKFGNASSIHHFGQETRAALDRARHQAAHLLNARPAEIVFTSGGTESNNLAIRGFAEANRKHGDHIVTTNIEHPAVGEVCADLAARGFRVSIVPVTSDGVVRVADVLNAITDETILVSIMTANNELGTLQPVSEIGRIVKSRRDAGSKIRFHTDAVQAAGKLKLDVEAIGCDLLSISGHKINAPKGAGLLYVRRGTRLHSQNLGGRQERGIRGGTENLPAIAALGRACEMAGESVDELGGRLKTLRDRFETAVCETIPGSHVNGQSAERLPNIANISFAGIEGEGLLINLDMQGVAVSTGSACSSGSIEPSPVIRALGVTDEMARGAVRFSFGRQNDDADVDRVMEILPLAVEALRRLGRK
ncbi:MAG: cysteine desulfurase [Acidobacteria bacterium]|nr:cysteine desulfurase [Acidobacteriota bacterium]